MNILHTRPPHTGTNNKMATINLTVKVQAYDDGNKFRINNIRQKTAEANAGDTLIFDQSDPSNANHPLRIGLYADASHKMNGSAYATGVTVSGVPGSSGAQTSFTVSDSALHGTYFYYCANHQGMGGLIHYGSEDKKYNLIDEGATMTDIEDGDATSQIHKKILKYNTATENWDTLYNIPYTATSPHTNPWRLIGTDSREAGSYRILYGSKNLVDAESANTERYLSVSSAPASLPQLAVGTTFWLVNGLDENGTGYTSADGIGDPTYMASYKNGFCISNPAGGVTVEGTRNAGYSIQGKTVKWTEPNHGRYPPVDAWARTVAHWRGQVTLLDETNYVGWVADTQPKIFGSHMQNGTYTVDDSGISFELMANFGLATFKIKLTSDDQLQDGAIIRCEDFQRINHSQTMTMVSAIKCGEGDVMPTSDFKVGYTWHVGMSDIEWG